MHDSEGKQLPSITCTKESVTACTSIISYLDNYYYYIIIVACIAVNIHCLVYTSTYNVVFGGQEIIYGDESLPYFPLEKVTMVTVVYIAFARSA